MSDNIWLRLHVETLHDRKVQSLAPELFRAWVNVLLIAKLHAGVLPDLATVAYHLHLTEPKAAILVGKLAGLGLLDPVKDGYFEPHNWHKRQYLTKKDNTAAERKARQRQREKENREREMGRDRRDSHAVTVTPPIAEQSRKEREDDDDDAGAREAPGPSASWNEAGQLADEIALICGYKLDAIPPSWCGAAYRTQQWLNDRWPHDLVIVSVRRQLASKRDGRPPSTIQFFEKGIVDDLARARAPLPKIVEMSASPVEVYRANSNSGNVVAAADQLIERVRELSQPPGIRSAEGAAAVRLLPQSGRK